MKKRIAAFVVAALLVVSFAFTASAATSDFDTVFDRSAFMVVDSAAGNTIYLQENENITEHDTYYAFSFTDTPITAGMNYGVEYQLYMDERVASYVSGDKLSMHFQIGSGLSGGTLTPQSVSVKIAARNTDGLLGLYTSGSLIVGSNGNCNVYVDYTFTSTLTIEYFSFLFWYSATASSSTVWLGVTKDVTITSKYFDEETDQITDAIGGAADSIIGEDFGYVTPDNPQVDSGIDAGGDILDVIDTALTDFDSQIDGVRSSLSDSINSIKPWIDMIFDTIPGLFQTFIMAVVFFLVIRKVVGR